MEEKKTIVFSGINLVEGGTLSIFKDILSVVISNGLYNSYEIIVLVNNKNFFKELLPYIKFKEYPLSKKGWIFRLYYEYLGFYLLSKKLGVYCWFSMHDITPNVVADKLVVYCHNSCPFYKFSFKDFMYDKKFGLFVLFYKYLYSINIQKNDYVIVQQGWIRDAFIKEYLLSPDKVVVASPVMDFKHYLTKINMSIVPKKKKTFIYPAFPRVFKNFEIICDAAGVLERSGRDDFEIIITIDGTENKYSNFIVKKYSYLKTVKFEGLMSREELMERYYGTDAMIFPSKLETWGLPISEYKSTNKPILIADLPYAYESIGEYDKACYFSYGDAQELAELMAQVLNNDIHYHEKRFVPDSRKINTWMELLSFIFT